MDRLGDTLQLKASTLDLLLTKGRMVGEVSCYAVVNRANSMQVLVEGISAQTFEGAAILKVSAGGGTIEVR